MLFSPSRLASPQVVLCLILLASSVGFAQAAQGAPPPAPTSTDETASPPLVPATEPPEQPPARGQVFPREPQEDTRDYLLVPRLILQPPAGFILAGVMGYASFYPTLLALIPFCGSGDFIDGFRNQTCDDLRIAGAVTGATFGASLGVFAVGKLLGGRGRFWHTLLGAMAGTATGAVLRLTADLPNAKFVGLLLAGQAIGATVAYAISGASLTTPADSSPQGASGLSVLPMLSTTQTGGLMGGFVCRF